MANKSTRPNTQRESAVLASEENKRYHDHVWLIKWECLRPNSPRETVDGSPWQSNLRWLPKLYFFFLSPFRHVNITNLSRQFTTEVYKIYSSSVFMNSFGARTLNESWISNSASRRNCNNNDTRGAVVRAKVRPERSALKMFILFSCFRYVYSVFYTRKRALKTGTQVLEFIRPSIIMFNITMWYTKNLLFGFLLAVRKTLSVHKIPKILIPNIIGGTPILFTFTMTRLLKISGRVSKFLCYNSIKNLRSINNNIVIIRIIWFVIL